MIKQEATNINIFTQYKVGNIGFNSRTFLFVFLLLLVFCLVLSVEIIEHLNTRVSVDLGLD